MTPAGLIAAFGATESFPAEPVAAAKRSILDAIAVAVAGSRSETASRARRALAPAAGTGPASILGIGSRAEPSTAALLNGIAAHALDFDDVWADDDGVRAWRGHPSVCVIPALLAAGEAGSATGADLLAGYIVGTEVAGKLGTAFGPGLGRAGWHPTVVLGAVAAAAGVARLLHLPAAEFERALAIAATEASGLHRNFGTDTKPFHAGHAARSGVDAALLARAGFTANPDAVAAYLEVYGADPVAALEVLGELGSVYDLVGPGLSLKKYPCCRFAHLPLDALFDLLGPVAVDPETVTGITVRIQPGADDALVCPAAATGLEGKFSMPYVLAAGVLDGRLTLASFTDEAVRRPAVRELMAKVTTEYRDEPGTEVVVAHAGRTDSRSALVVRGDPANPLTRAEELEKVRSCLEGALDPSLAERLGDQVDRLAELRSVKELTATLVQSPARV